MQLMLAFCLVASALRARAFDRLNCRDILGAKAAGAKFLNPKMLRNASQMERVL
jgi:hypothetical protein